jgi:hypothetical protein
VMRVVCVVCVCVRCACARCRPCVCVRVCVCVCCLGAGRGWLAPHILAQPAPAPHAPQHTEEHAHFLP